MGCVVRVSSLKPLNKVSPLPFWERGEGVRRPHSRQKRETRHSIIPPLTSTPLYQEGWLARPIRRGGEGGRDGVCPLAIPTQTVVASGLDSDASLLQLITLTPIADEL